MGFTVATQSKAELIPMYRKLNYLVSNTAPDYGPTGRMRTPFTRLTIGSWCDRIPGVINSVNLKWQKDYPWEIAISGPEGNIDKHMHVLPHVLDVSVQFTPVHNFLPEKSMKSPFILPHSINRWLPKEQKWLDADRSDSFDKASFNDVRERMGVERQPEALDKPPQQIPPPQTDTIEATPIDNVQEERGLITKPRTIIKPTQTEQLDDLINRGGSDEEIENFLLNGG